MSNKNSQKLGYWWLFSIGLVAIVWIFIGAGRQSAPKVSINLISGYDWTHMTGSQQRSDKVGFTPVNRKIVEQDGSGGQPNSPVNLAGPVVKFSGDFELKATVSNFSPGDSISLYGGVPIIYDEWRYEPPSAKITEVDSSITVDLFDGKSAKPSKSDFKIASTDIKKINFVRQGQSLAIYINESFAGSISVKDLFTAGKLWIGAEANSNPWQLDALKFSGPAGQVSAGKALNFNKSRPSQVTLQGLAQKNQRPVKIGAAVAINPLLTDTNYRQLALNQFGIWTPENDLKPQFIHPSQNIYSFNEADLLVDTAIKNNIAVHGHTLVFGEANPKWMQDSPLIMRQQIMADHITNTINHFKDRIHEWDVINEPLSDEDEDYASNGLRRHLWYQAMGEDYIPIALQTAHQADPSAELYINDYGLEADGQRWDALLKLIQKLQSEGTPLSGIGFEAHVYESGDEIDGQILANHFKQLADLGLKVRISEADVHGENQRIQKQQYATAIMACLNAANCTAFSTWGITDKYGSTTEINSYPLSYGNDLLWDKDFNAKPAYFELAKILRSQ